MSGGSHNYLGVVARGAALERQTRVHLVVFEQGGLMGAYLDEDRARMVAQLNEGAVMVSLPATEDYRARRSVGQVPRRGRIDSMTEALSERDPEPPLGCVVATVDGVEWEHVEGTYGRDFWVRVDDPGGDPESWNKIAGNYGPVRLVRTT